MSQILSHHIDSFPFVVVQLLDQVLLRVQWRPLQFQLAALLHLPLQPRWLLRLQFQLAAQEAAAGTFVAVAGYGDCAMWYLGEDRIYTDRGGYEQSWAFTGPCHELMVKTIRELLLEP